MSNRKKLIFIDVDGTLINFKNMDKKIISEIYGDNKVVKVIDKILWFFNDFDIIGYNNFIFFIRMYLYSALTDKHFAIILEQYKKLYSMYAKKQITPALKYSLDALEFEGYEIHIVTRNMYAICLSEILDKKIHVVRNKRHFYSKLYDNPNVACIIGNNYMDDIMACYNLNKLYKKRGVKNEAKSIYIGSSKILKCIVNKKTLCFRNITKCLKYLEKVID